MNITYKTTEELVKCLSLFNGAGICTIESSTVVKTKVKNKDGDRFDASFPHEVFCRKIQTVNVGINYENAVNKKLKDDGKDTDFIAGPLKWGKWIKPNLLIEHNGGFYLRYYTGYLKSVAKFEYHFADGTVLGKSAAEKLKSFMKELPKKDPDDVQPRNTRMENIIRMEIGGNTYMKI